MANVFVEERFVGPNWRDLHLRTGEVGATWTRHPAVNSGQSRWYIFGNRVHCGVWGNMIASGEAASPDHWVDCTYRIYTTVSGLNLGIAVRMHPTNDTYYGLYYQAGELVLFKRVSGVTTSLGTWISTLTGGGTDYALRLEAIGTAIKAYVNDVERIAVTDSDIATGTRVGLRSIGINDAATGNHIDNFVATDTSTPPAGRSYAVGFMGI